MAGTSFKGPLKHSLQSPAHPYAYRGGKGMVPSAEWVVFFDDFLGPEAAGAAGFAAAEDVPFGWGGIIVDTGGTLVKSSTETGGVVVLTSDGATEGVSVYMDVAIQVDSRPFYMEARVRCSDTDDQDLQIGLTDLTAVTNPEDLWTTASADVIAWGLLDGDATPAMLCDKNNSGSTIERPSSTDFDLTDQAWHILAFEVGGTDTNATKWVKGYVDGQLAHTWSTETTIPDDVNLAPFFGARTGADPAHNAWVDYVKFSYKRTT